MLQQTEKSTDRFADVMLSHKALHTVIHALNEQQTKSAYADEVLKRLNDIDDYFNSNNAEVYHTVIN